MKDQCNQSKFHNIPQILTKIRSKLQYSNKLFKLLNLNDKSKLELQHFMLSIGNYMNLIQQQVELIQQKNRELEESNKQYRILYNEYYQKYLNIQKQMQKQMSISNNKNAKLTKQNQFLSFVNKGLKNQIQQKKKYIDDYKNNKSKQIKCIMKNVQTQVKKGAQNICQKINKFMDLWQNESQNNNSINMISKQIKNEDVGQVNKQNGFQEGSNLFSTQKKRSWSVNHNSTQIKKKKIEDKLAKIVFEQAKLCQKNDKYLQAYLS